MGTLGTQLVSMCSNAKLHALFSLYSEKQRRTLRDKESPKHTEIPRIKLTGSNQVILTWKILNLFFFFCSKMDTTGRNRTQLYFSIPILWLHSSSQMNLWCKCIMLSCFSLVWLFCNPTDYSPSSSPVYGILQARILEWIAISSSRGYSWPRDQTRVSYICIGRQVLYY